MYTRSLFECAFVWKGLLWTRDALSIGLCWEIGSGMNLGFLDYPKLPSACLHRDDTKLTLSSSYWNNG